MTSDPAGDGDDLPVILRTQRDGILVRTALAPDRPWPPASEGG
jgi:hypothetical protein